MAILHTVNKSPFEKNALASCLSMSKAGSSILLIEDGVYGATSGGSIASDVTAALSDRKIYVLGADMAARGMADKVIDGITVVDYSGFVDLTIENDTVQAWL